MQYIFYHKYTAIVTDKVVIEAPEGLTAEQVLELHFDTPTEHIPDGDKIPPDATAKRRYDLEEEVDNDFGETIAWYDDNFNIIPD